MTEQACPQASYDLHLHSYWSYDATADPEFYFKCARKHNVRCIAITDHHVLDSIHDVLSLSARYPEVRAVPAAELGVTTSEGIVVDLLCYGFRKESLGELEGLTDMLHDWQVETGEALSRSMQILGYDFTDEHRLELLNSYRPSEVIEVQGNTQVRNTTVREYFIKRGFIPDADAFPAFMKRVYEIPLSPPFPDADRVVPAVKKSGALIAIAHPFDNFNKADVRQMDALKEECGLDGIECAHPAIPTEYTPLYRDYCIQHELFSVGGSDCHSEDVRQSEFACHEGKDEWLDEFLARLQ
jgi:3',5'-nucleoside bisphosphate phosphatase